MKRKNILIVMLLVLTGFIIIPGCTIDEPTPQEFYAFTAAVPSSPLDGELASAVITATDTTIVLTWSTEDLDGDTPNADVYFGEDADPPLFKEGHNSLSITVPVKLGRTYHWRVVMWDANNVRTDGEVYSFVVAVNFNGFSGTATELWNSQSSTVNVSVDEENNTITLDTPLADGMVSAGWGTVYTGVHPIIITYNPATMAVTSTKQLWLDSFIDPTEMGPMSLQIASGTIDGLANVITVRWIVSGNAYWGADYTTTSTTYTMD